MTTERDLMTDLARRQARDALLNARATLERALREVDDYLEHFDGAADDRKRARVINGAINVLTGNILTNLRLDRLADAQAELTRLAD